MRQKNLSVRQHRWLDVLSEFNFNIEYIPGETNEFADTLLRIYSDKLPGVSCALSEYIDDKNKLKTYLSVKVQPVYIEAYLLTLMNTKMRWSSRLANKPSPNYKETEERRPKVTSQPQEEVMAEKALASKLKPEEKHTPNEPTLNELKGEQEAVATQMKPKEMENRLFGAASEIGILFPECIKGRYIEDDFFKPILSHPGYFTNFIERNELVYFTSKGVEIIAIPNVKVARQNVREILIRQGHSILTHLGTEKMATYLREQIWWKTTIADIKKYCKSCHTCCQGHSTPSAPSVP